MAVNNFLPFGTANSSNVIDQVTYSGLAARSSGFSSGTAKSAELNKVWRQSSIMASIIGQYITDQGYDALDDGDTDNLLANLKKALAVQIDAQSGNFVIDSGSANAYVVAIDPPITAYPDGMTFRFRAANANTGASTLNAGAGALALRNNQDGVLVAGDIPALSLVTVTYVQALGHFVVNSMVPSQTNAGFVKSGFLHLRDEKSVATAGGSSVVGLQTRTLNTVATNSISGASLASNQITLPAGTYRVWGRAPVFNVDGNKALLYNVTDAAVTLNGSSNDGLTGQNSDSFIIGQFTISAAKVFEVRHYCATATATNGLGNPANLGGFNEVYTEIQISQVS